LARGDGQLSAPDHTRLYVLDESSLASTKQMHTFLERLGPQDRVLLVGDVRQHEAVDAGRPYHQLQEACTRIRRSAVRTSRLVKERCRRGASFPSPVVISLRYFRLSDG
jgi:ATP-dependent exoDNAse (exonuclease V) alpha subunit